jgi:hypothetical protein
MVFRALRGPRGGRPVVGRSKEGGEHMVDRGGVPTSKELLEATDAVNNGAVVGSGWLVTAAVGVVVARLVYVPPALGQLGPAMNPGFDHQLVRIWPGVLNAQWPPAAMDLATYANLIKAVPQGLVA